jgi:flagellar biosynthesis GTPase FlhF
MSTPGELLEALGRQARARLGNGGDGAVRTYRGRSVDELIPVIQRELGAEAIVVRRREGLTGGVLGFFQHPFVEIEAMPGAPGVDIYDEDHSVAAPELPPAALAPAVPPIAAAAPSPPLAPPPAPAPPPPAQTSPQPSTGPPSLRTPAYAPPSSGLPQSPPLRVPAYAPPPPPAPFPPREQVAPSASPGSAYVTAHLAALARASRSRAAASEPSYGTGTREPTFETGIREPAYRRAQSERRSEPQPWSNDFQEIAARELPQLFPRAVEPAPPPPPRTGERRVVAPGSHTRARAGVAKSLQRYGISEELAHELIDGASAHALALAPRAGMAQAVRSTLAQRIPVAPPLPTRGAAIVVVGAGGSGKTTCCAALLGAYRKSSSLPASFASITREAEREELRLILSPHIMKPTPARAPRALRALRRARSEGLAVLDTPNLSPADRAGIRELAGLLAEMKPERVVVALPATLGAAAAAQLLAALRPLGANSLAVTHADETDQIGVAVEAACAFGLAPEYVLDRGRAGGWRLSRVDPAGLAARLLQ